MHCCRPRAGSHQETNRWSRILEQKQSSLFDRSTLLIIFTAIVAVAFFSFASNMSNFTSDRSLSEAEYHASVEERIRPFGRIKLPGEEHTADELKVDEVPLAELHATTLSGPQVFNEACIVCHGSGIGGAPTLEDSAAWASRTAQGMETLYQHALEGYTGSAGYMPPKGARLDLSDEEVNSAVDYMLSQVP
jgi:cytochrome c5